MKKTNINGKNDQRNVNPNWFTGKTWMKVLSGKIKSKDQDIYHVHFEKRCKMRLVSLSQLFIQPRTNPQRTETLKKYSLKIIKI